MRSSQSSQAQLAEELGISRRRIAYCEAESSHPPAALLQDLARALNTSIEELLDGEKPRQKRRSKSLSPRLERRLQQIEPQPQAQAATALDHRLLHRHRTEPGIPFMKLKTPRLTTIGYEGASLEAFLATLKAAGVTLLLDIRELPISRRKGFSKTPLSQALATAGIHYRHERALGAPKQVRHRLRTDGDLKRYFIDFREYLATQGALLDQLAKTLTGCVALLCFERNPAECHRSVVVAALAKRLKIEFLHLTVSADDAKQAPAYPRAHPRQGLPST